MTQYRIKELEGVFTIEGSYELTYNMGNWLNRNMVTETFWSNITKTGRPIDALKRRKYSPAFHIRADVFSSLNSAQEYIDKNILKTKALELGIDKPIYHEIGVIPCVDSERLDKIQLT
jgi:hypothetical protein